MIFLLFLSLPLLLTVGQMFLKQFTMKSIDVEHSSHIYLLVTSIVAMLFFAIKVGFQLSVNLPTIIYASVLALLSILSNILTLKSLGKMDAVTISVFSGAGSIAIPFLFGALFLNEKVNGFKIISFFLLLVVVIKPLMKRTKAKTEDWTGCLYCVLLFFVGGAATVFFKLYAVAENVMSDETLCFWANVLMLPFVFVSLLKTDRQSFFSDVRKMTKGVYLIAVISVLISNSTSLLEIYVLQYMDLTLFTLLKNPVSLIMTAILFRIFYGEKMTKEKAFSVGLSIVALVLNSL